MDLVSRRLHLQRTIGNQALQRLLREDGEVRERSGPMPALDRIVDQAAQDTSRDPEAIVYEEEKK